MKTLSHHLRVKWIRAALPEVLDARVTSVRYDAHPDRHAIKERLGAQCNFPSGLAAAQLARALLPTAHNAVRDLGRRHVRPCREHGG